MINTIDLPIDLGAQGYVRFVKKVSEGRMATTFLALVNYEGSVRRSYIKIYDHLAQPKAAINEVLGYLYAQAMGMPSPAVFLIDIPALDVAASGFLPLPALPMRAIGTLEAHDSRNAGDGTAKTLYMSSAGIDLPQIKHRLISSPAGRTLMAFDEALGNSDRNIGNIVFSKKHGVVAIDHGGILTGPLWSAFNLNSTHDQQNLVFHILDQTPIVASDRNALMAAAQVMLETYFEQLVELMTTIGYPVEPDLELTAAFDFVWWKSMRLNERVATMLKVIP